MKRKVMVKSLPKAQVGLQPSVVLTDEQKAIWKKNQGMFGNPPAPSNIFADVYTGDPNSNITGPLIGGVNPFAISIPADVYQGSNTNITGQPTGSGTPLNMPAGFKQSNQQKSWNYFKPDQLPKVPTTNKKYNPYIAPILLAGTDLFRSITKKIEGADAQNNFKNQFLSDRLYTPKQDDATDNRGDYLTNTPGFGLDFRPDQAIYGDYNKIAQMGGEMKRKVRITSLPQAGYGGTQDAKAVNQLYGNSAYMMNMFNGATEGVPQEEYNKTLTPDPRSVSVLEAEKGETLVRKGTNSTIPELFTIGGKRHSEGGTPLGPEKATPDSFIYSDTKAMKIKDPDILKSFGFTAKKGGYTPATISKKFDLNSKDLREGLYSETDPLRKSTAILMADNYISNLGKLALVQEAKKGFPQGAPEIAKPYMEKIGLDPAQFLPPSSEEGMTMAMYGGIPTAQIGRSVGSNSESYVNPFPFSQSMTPSPYYKENNFGPTSGIAIGPDGKPIKLRSDVYDFNAPYNISNKPNARNISNNVSVYPQKIDWSLLDDPSFMPTTTSNQVQNNSNKPTAIKPVVKPKPTTQTAQPKTEPKPNTGYTTPDGSVIKFEYGGIPLAQNGAITGEFLAKHTDASGKEYNSYLQGDKVVLVDTNNEVVSTRSATEKDKPSVSTYDTEEKKLLKSIAPNLILPEDYVEANQLAKVAKIPGTFGRFDKVGADKNWSWYGKPIDWTNESQVGEAQLGYNKEMYNRFIKADYTPEEATKYVKTIGFDESKTSGIPNALDKKAGKYSETRVVFDVPPKPKKQNTETVRDQIETNQLNTNAVRNRPIGFYPQDVLNSSAALADLTNINRYYPKMTQFTPQSMKPTYYDPNRELANNAEMANIAAQNMSQFTGPQAFNSRFAETQGRGLANAANVLGKYNNLNVGVANQFEQANTQLMNEAYLKNAMMSNDFYDKTNITNQQYDNSMRAARRQLVDYNNAALTNRFMTDQMNSLYPNFYVNPSALQTYYNPGQQITPKQKGNDMMAYLNSTGIPFDFTNPNVQTALLKGMMGDVNTDERGNIVAASAAANNRRRSK
jgi:hypothetical protein